MSLLQRIKKVFNQGSPEVSRREAFSTFAFWRTSRRSTSGFVILFAILISVIMLLLGFGIFSVATKQSILSSGAREAQYAFTAADTGSECALYAEATGLYLILANQSLSCADNTIDLFYDGNNGFFFNAQVDTTTCVLVTIKPGITGGTRTITSQGYSLCSGDQPQTGNPRLAERDLEITYAIPGTVQTPGQGNGGTGGNISNTSPTNIGSGNTGTSQLGGNTSGTSPTTGTITGSSQLGTGQVSNQQPSQMQVQAPQDIVIQKLLPLSTITDTTSSQTMRQVDGSGDTSFVKSASQTVTRAAQSVANAVDSAFRAVADLVK